MSKELPKTLVDNLNVIWTIASKDILDALKNKVVVSMILMLSIMLLLPKMLPTIFDQPPTVLKVYDEGDSQQLTEALSSADISVKKVRSIEELGSALCGAMFPEIGLQIPVGFDQHLIAGERIEIQGYGCWSKRHQVADVKPKLEDTLSRALGLPVTIQTEENIVYPPSDGVLLLSLATVNSVLLILMIGIFLVPSLLFEEKETKTMHALLVSPASIGQVVIGKALAGAFYILVAAAIIFFISWPEVIHWDMVVLFVIGSGFFSVAVGLLMGSIFEKAQDMVGWMIALLVILIGAVLVEALGMELPTFVQDIVAWIPSVALAEVCHAAFSEIVPVARIWTNLLIVLLVSVPLYALVIWKVRRSDR